MSNPSEPASVHAPAPDAVRQQLQTLLASDKFANSPRLSRFLSFVVEQTLAGNGGDLKEYRIGVDVFQRPETYDPKVDPVVRVDARQLRFKLSEYYESTGRLDPVLIMVPKGGYSARFELAGAALPEATAPTEPLAAPGEFAIPEPSAPESSSLIGSPRWSNRRPAIGAVLVVVLAAAGSWFVSSAGRAPVPLVSIAVLPFVNLSGDPANEYFTDGLTDEITDALARTKALRIIARSSAFQFKGKNVDARQAGRELNVSAILTGTVSRTAGRIKVVAQLARVSDDSVEWSKRYERTESDLFALQSSLASDIAANLRVTVTPAAARPAVRDVRAQDFFMRARYEADQLTRESLLRAVADYEHAIRLDPNYAAAHYGLAVARHRLPAYANDPGLFDRPAIERSYRRASELDPNFPEPHTGLALILAYGDWNWAGAERELEVASAIGTSAMAQSHMALLSLIRGRRGEVAEHIRRARDLDPLGVAILMNTAEIQVMAGEYQGAREVLERFSSQHPDVVLAQFWIGLSYLFEGRPEEALGTLRYLEGKMPDVEAYEAAAHALAGQRADALRILAASEGLPGHSEIAIATAYGYLRDEGRALQWIGKSVARREPAGAYLGVLPAFAFLRGKPEFQEIARRSGLAVEQ